MKLTASLSFDRRAHVEGRLHSNLMAWLTTVRPSGQPDSVPVWFLAREDDSILLFSEPGTLKLRNIQGNPLVALGLDVTDIGRDIIRIDGSARRADEEPPANEVPGFVSKYTERVGAIFGTIEDYAAKYCVPIVITPLKLHA